MQKRDVLFQINSQIGCAVNDVVAIHAAAESLSFIS
jgi:hypothetical protein